MVRRNVRGDIGGDKSAIDMGWAATFTRAVGFDGAGPERDSLPTWRGVLTTLVLIIVVGALILFAYSLAVADPHVPTA